MTSGQQKLNKQLSLFTDDDFIKTYLFFVIKAISHMKTNNLKVLLKDKYIYNEITKELFIKKLNQIFKELKNAGDTELFYYQGICSKKNISCNHCGKKGFRFVVNQSNNYLDLIFEIDKNDIKNINICYSFETDIKFEGLKEFVDISINLDDRETFNKTPEYWSKVNAAEAAYLEIVTSPTKKIDFDEVCYWVDKYLFTNKRIGNNIIFDPTMRWSDFSSLYYELDEIKIFINDNLPKIIEANKSLEQSISETELIVWVIHQEETIKTAGYEALDNYNKADSFFPSSVYNNINLCGEVFDQVFNYIDVFNKNNNELLKKYRVYTFEERCDFDNYEDYKYYYDDILSFHIETRKKLVSQGILIPFYLDNLNEDN